MKQSKIWFKSFKDKESGFCTIDICCDFEDSSFGSIAVSKAKTEKEVYKLAAKRLYQLAQIAEEKAKEL